MLYSFLDFIAFMFSNAYFFILIILLSIVVFTNGFSEAPITIASCVSNRVLTPKRAIVLSFVFNFLGMLVFSIFNAGVAKTMFNVVSFGSNMNVSLIALASAILVVIIWTSVASLYGIPTSASHALVASITGASVAVSGSFLTVNLIEWVRVVSGIAVSLIAGFFGGFLLAKIIEGIFRHFDRRRTFNFFKISQIFGGAFMAFMHGAQAGLKFIGVFILGIMLVSSNDLSNNFQIPFWLMIYCSLLMMCGLAFGGRRIIKTIGSKMSDLELYQGACVDVSSALSLFLASIFNIPISTAHTKSVSIMGVSASRRISSINWGVVRDVVLAGIITFPCCFVLTFIVTKIVLFI